MTDDEALKRGAEAGRALALALKDIIEPRQLQIALMAAMAAIGLVLATPAEACHRFSVWRYPYPQRCSFRVAQTEAPTPPTRSPVLPEPEPDADIPLPSLENMEFPPDATGEAGERLKGVGLLRQLLGTN